MISSSKQVVTYQIGTKRKKERYEKTVTHFEVDARSAAAAVAASVECMMAVSNDTSQHGGMYHYKHR